MSSIQGPGNRCGHVVDAPTFFMAPACHKPRPKILTRLGAAIERYYQSPKDVLPVLNFINGSCRKQRSERREACLRLMGVIIHYTDLVSLHVGTPQPDGSIGAMTVARMAELAQMEIRRTERAMHDLRKAGLITVQQLSRPIDGLGHRGLAAIKSLSSQIFAHFGLGKWFVHEQRKALDRKKQRIRKSARQYPSGLRQAYNLMHGLVSGASNSKHSVDGAAASTPCDPREYFKIIRSTLSSPV